MPGRPTQQKANSHASTLTELTGGGTGPKRPAIRDQWSSARGIPDGCNESGLALSAGGPEHAVLSAG
jgi:hypothetical protein